MSNEQIYLRVQGHFDAAHNLINYDGKCANLHGHRWNVYLEVGPFCELDLDRSGIAYDFKDLKPLLNEVLDRYDHQYLNNFFALPSAETIALSIFRELKGKLNGKLYALEVFESPESRCRVVNHDT